MTEYRYRAVTADGEARKGVLTAPNSREARSALKAMALLPVSLVESGGETGAPETASRSPIFRRGISAGTLAQITRQIASLLANDIRIEDALSALTEQGLPRRANIILLDIRRAIVEGQSLANAMAAHPGIFSRSYISSISAGEASGRLDAVFDYLADYLDARKENRQSIQLALIYPAFLTLVSGAIIALLLVKVVPDVIAVYQRRGKDLPLPTDLLILLSDGLIAFGGPALIASLATVLLFRWWWRRPAGKLAFDRWILSVPIAGRFVRKQNAADLSSSFSMLLQSGVTMVDALKISASTLTNTHMVAALKQAATDIAEGAALDHALKTTGLLPPMVLAIISSGLKSGKLGDALSRSAAEQQRGLQAQIKAFVALLEPAVLLIMGALVLFIVMAILTPIVSLNTLSGV